MDINSLSLNRNPETLLRIWKENWKRNSKLLDWLAFVYPCQILLKLPVIHPSTILLISLRKYSSATNTHLLFLSSSHSLFLSFSPVSLEAGIVGLISFFTAIHLAHKSLLHKLKGRNQQQLSSSPAVATTATTQSDDANNNTLAIPSSSSASSTSSSPSSTGSHSADTSANASGDISPSTSGGERKVIEYLTPVPVPYEYVFSIGK